MDYTFFTRRYVTQLILIILGAYFILHNAQQGLVNGQTILGFILASIGAWGILK